MGVAEHAHQHSSVVTRHTKAAVELVTEADLENKSQDAMQVRSRSDRAAGRQST